MNSLWCGTEDQGSKGQYSLRRTVSPSTLWGLGFRVKGS
jgi:hypothetical protein